MANLNEQVRYFVKTLERRALEDAEDPTMPKGPKSSDVKSWSIVLADGTKRIDKGIEARVVDGCLVLNNGRDLDVVLVGAGQWKLCELIEAQ